MLYVKGLGVNIGNGYAGTRGLQLIALALLGGFIALWNSQLQATEAKAGRELINEHCADCHKPNADGSLARISEARRTPEGWDMTVARMTLIHGTTLTFEQRKEIVKYLADTAGLAPEETQSFRYVLERRPGATDFIEDPLVGDICAHCHSFARIGLQRRSEADWLRLAHFHVGQFPTVELQNGLRSMNWWEIAAQKIPKILGKLYPLDAGTWKKWQQRPKMNPSGVWRIVGHRPGWGDYEGVASVIEKTPDEYALTFEMRYANGKTQNGSGSAIIYTGYEWRGSVTQGEEKVHQVFTLSDDGNHLQGRWHLADVDALGGDLRGTKIGAKPEILAVTPGFVKAGEKQQLTIHGVALTGDVSLDGGISVTRMLSRASDKMVIEVQTTPATAKGWHAVQVGDTTAKDLLNVYQQIDFVHVEPQPGLARVGGNGGKIPAAPVQFEAVAYSVGPDGEAGTNDDVRIGIFPARWSVANLNASAVAMKDALFAGQIDATGGLFTPAAAGPNPKRKFGANNVGELKITAIVADGKHQVKATAPLIVTVQRWVDPPVR